MYLRGQMLDRLQFAIARNPRAVLSNGLTTVGLLAVVLDTSRLIDAQFHFLIIGTILVVWGYIAVEFFFRLKSAGAERRHYLFSAGGLIDLATVIAIPVGWLLVRTRPDAQLFAVVWALRYVQHGQTTGLTLLARTLRRSSAALLSVAIMFLVIFVLAATLAYVFERDAQPEAFGSVPRAMWWAITTLTTTGYGDLVPVTVWGRLLAGWVMIGGIVMFALQAGVIAGAFAEELQRRHFLHTWDLVTTVPFFEALGAAAIADIVRLLQTRDVAEGTVIVRQGQPGDAMYFIVAGEVAVQLSSGAGDSGRWQLLRRDGFVVRRAAVSHRGRHPAERPVGARHRRLPRARGQAARTDRCDRDRGQTPIGRERRSRVSEICPMTSDALIPVA